MELELRAARLPFVGCIAHHYWFVVIDGGEPQRWEVWQWRDAGGESWGHLHRNLLPCDQGVGNGPSWVARTWRGADAAELAGRLARAPDEYPWRNRYFPWPGPNSNTFVRWVLQDPSPLPWQALGKRFPARRPLIRRGSPRPSGRKAEHRPPE